MTGSEHGAAYQQPAAVVIAGLGGDEQRGLATEEAQRRLFQYGQHAFQAVFQRRVVQEFVTTVQEGEFLRPDELSGLSVPAALVWGLADTFLPRGSLEFFRDNLPAAPTLLLQHCGHLPQQERPRAVARFIHQYAEQLHARAPRLR